MRFVPRALGHQLLRAAKGFPALIVTGPRRAGKTTLLRQTFPKASYVLLEDLDVIARVRADPRSFLSELRAPVILDEIQNVPELLNYLRTAIDRFPRRTGQWLLTGSQEAPLMKGVTESMAGRAAILSLLPLSVSETPKVSWLNGGFPEVLARPSAARLWFQSYLQTYLERDVRAASSIRDLATFRRFLALTATRTGQMLNKTDLATPLGVSVPTITEWLSILELTCQILLVPPYFENFGKRLVKSPKLYFTDPGLLCHLLNIDTEPDLRQSPFAGPIFEGFVASEIVKQQLNAGRRRELYYFRDRQGLEVDFLVPLGGKRIALVEAKATATPKPQMADGIARLSATMPGFDVSAFLACRRTPDGPAVTTLRPGIKALTVEELLAQLPPNSTSITKA